MSLDLSLTVDAFWGARSHYLEPVRRYVDGAPCYCLDLVRAGDKSEEIDGVNDYRRFGFYNRDWWRFDHDWEDWAEADLLAVSPVWGLRNHWVSVVRRHEGMKLTPFLKLVICDADDPRRFGTYRGSTWRIEGDCEGER